MLAFGVAFAIAPRAVAVEPDEVLADPALEARARDISRQLRCVVCQSQSIDDSNAPLAKDMRLIVRERLVAGDSNEEVYAYLVERYGDYVLLNPPIQKNTIVLWAAPLVIFLGAGASAAFYLANMRRETEKAAAAAAERDETTA
ncbi:MAG: cytochrome C biogenesis protein [Alphaproteobacteria bacterium RIFCSPHIGHO2_12_FULL_63_12]|nr:MAG: cytochrome C biogenesis protein [Alphaproteobacteria bacterium RIFCSPHIGHO2_12_FULL_63_12]